MSTAQKLDLYRLHKADYAAPRKPVLLDVAPARYLAIEGTGQPGGEEFQTAAGALFATAYTLKFHCKAAGRDYSVCKFEALYWTDQGGCGFQTLPMNEWHWMLIIRVPDFVTGDDMKAVRAKLKEKGTPRAADVSIKTVKQGRCAQMLHVGPYNKEHETLEKMRAVAAENGYEFGDRHHEIYLNDPQRTASEKLRTILRMELRRAAKSAGA